ncbi:MAG: hypothetical protein OXT71_01945 [Acidobacteriota bacterium]|nr:hypothetical protein [Acidobacteriota bacterium]
MSSELAQWVTPAVIVAVLLYIHRYLRQDMAQLRRDTTQMESRLWSRMDRMESQFV